MDNNINSTLELLDQILGSTNFEDVSSESSGFESLPDGYYLSEVEEAKLTTSKSSGQPMVSFRFKIVENGIYVKFEETGEITFVTQKGTQNRKIFKHYVLKDEAGVKRFASDMLKFEDETGDSLLPREAFTNSETLLDALDVLESRRIYVQSDTREKDDGTKSNWVNLISWKRVNDLGLPV